MQNFNPTVGDFAGWSWKKFGRGAAAVLTGGASEIAFNRKLRKKLKQAASSGWDGFSKTVKDTLKSFKGIDSVGDVMNIVKVTVTGGASLAGDAAVTAVQDAILELLSPYLAQVAQTIGKGYGKGRSEVRQAVRRAIKKAGGNSVIQRIGAEFVNANYDLLLGYPPCVCEKGCIKPVADGLARSAVPYIKAIGEALKVIYPIVQGEFTGGPQDSQALYLYASGEVPLLPNAKLPGGAGKTLENVLDVLGDEYAAGVPQSFTKYSPYLVDLVARGKPGPYVYGSNKRADWYFANPLKAEAVLVDADKIGGVLNAVDKYLRKINRYWEMGKSVVDLYQAVAEQDFTFSLSEWDSADVKKFAEGQFQDIQGWAIAKTKDYQNIATGVAGAAKSKALGKAQQYKSLSQLSLKDLPKLGSSAIGTGKQAAAAKLPGKIIVPPRMFGAPSTAQAFMGDWQIAQIGLYARARYNDMARLWLSATPAQRKQWKDAPARRWRDEAVDYPMWYRKFSKSEKMRKMVVAQKAHDMPMQKLSLLLNVAKATGNPITPVLADVVNSRGQMAGVANLAKIAMGIGVVDAKQSAQKAVEEGLISQTEIDAFEGSKGKTNWTVPVIAGAAITGIAAFALLKR